MQEDTLEKQHMFRHYMPELDITSLAHLLTSVEDVDHDGEDTSEAALRDQLTWPNHHPEFDCRVIEDLDTPHALIGYSSVYAQTPGRSTLYVVIHPNWRRKGHGSALFSKSLDRARETGTSEVTIYANAQNTAANSFLNRHGFRVAGDSWVLLAPSDIVLEIAHCPAGYSVGKSSAEQHLSELVEVMNRSYGDKWGHAENVHATTEEQIKDWFASADPEGIFLAFAPDGSVVGFCRSIRATEQSADGVLLDQLKQPGIVPEHRHQGLYRTLTLTAIHWLRTDRSQPIVLQSWGDDEQTVAVYREIGFTLTQHFRAYRREIHYNSRL